ncbi:MAG TPA: hypothetical protein VMX13_04990 [Sedimentisphaerales bacterium]|nr:hypothetical protein [Sedimentisphaerales bacterium]
MSPGGRNQGGRVAATDNLYTVVLALAFGVVLATAVFVTYKCYRQYGSVLKVSKPAISRFAPRTVR